MSGKKKSYLSIILLCSIVVLLFLYLAAQNHGSMKTVERLEGGWTFSLNDSLSSAQPADTLSSYIFPDVKKGDVITLSRTIHESDAKDHMIAFDTWHTVTNVYLDGALLYTYGNEYAQKEQMFGNVRHYIDLPSDYTGKTLSLELTATEVNPMPYLTSVAYYEPSNDAVFWFNRPLILLFLGMFFVFLGIIIAFISCIFTSYKNISFEQLMLGICIILTGIYILSRGNFIQVLITDPVIYNAIEYVSLILLPLPMLLYWYHDAVTCPKSGVRAGYYICVVSNCIFTAVSVLLNFTTSIHLCQLLPLFYVLVLFVAIIVVLLIKYQDKSASNIKKKIYILGICSFLAGAILSIIAFRLCYNVYMAEKLELWKWYNYILPFAMCVLVIFFFMAFFIDMKQILENNYRNEFLKYIAYSDAMTKLYNRRRFEEDIENLLQNPDTGIYGIISIDINNLKKVNDNLGHSAGDMMLVSFSRILSLACVGAASAYRLGGDEFAVLATHNPETECPNILKRMQEAIDLFNEESHPFTLSAAYGMSTSLEASDPQAILELADTRMYENKKRMKS